MPDSDFRSTSSLSMLPASPKIFHGRDAELEHLVSLLLKDEPVRVAILGPGGIGKSSLALSCLHHQDITARFERHRFFISCDSAASATELTTRVAAHFGIQTEGNLLKAVIRHFGGISAPSLLVLDNLETSWELRETRSEVEDFISLLSDLEDLNIIVRYN